MESHGRKESLVAVGSKRRTETSIALGHPVGIGGRQPNRTNATIVHALRQNRAERLTREAILKLHNLQTTEGGWSWFSGMKTNFLVSINTLEGFSRLRKLGIPLDESEIKEMQISAVAYLDKMIVNQKKKNPDKNLSYEDICYLYVRSSYRDIPLAGETLDLQKKMVE